MSAGYSWKSLSQKLGIQEGTLLCVVNEPDEYRTLLGELPKGVHIVREWDGPADFIHFFTIQRVELEDKLPKLKEVLAQHGMIWISWPKRSSGVQTDVNEGVVREIGLRTGLVDVKVCAVNETWSGLKFVYRLRDRK